MVNLLKTEAGRLRVELSGNYTRRSVPVDERPFTVAESYELNARKPLVALPTR